MSIPASRKTAKRISKHDDNEIKFDRLWGMKTRAIANGDRSSGPHPVVLKPRKLM